MEKRVLQIDREPGELYQVASKYIYFLKFQCHWGWQVFSSAYDLEGVLKEICVLSAKYDLIGITYNKGGE